MKCAILFVCLSFTIVDGQFLKNNSRVRVNKEASLGAWHSIELPLNHFDVLDNRTFRARYITNDQFYKKGGPIIVYIGGEWEIEDYGVMGGVAFQLARQHNGFIFYPEHRYFGKSLPFPKPVSTDNLRYITPDYSLADLVYSISHIKETVEGLKNSQVIVTGGSYAGALAVWARLKYPHIIDIAYACGAGIKTETFNSDYFQISYTSLKKVNPECADIIKSGYSKAHQLMKSETGTAKLNSLFPFLVCNETDVMFDFAHRIHVCFNAQVWPVYKTAEICHYLVTNTTGSPLERLSQAAPYTLDNTDENMCFKIDREWFFMVCTFLGNMHVTNQSNYGDIDNTEYTMRQTCINIFGSKFNQEFVDAHTYRATLLYGGNTPDITKVLSLQGTHDPWYPSSIVDDLNDETPVVYIKDANHCLEIGEEQPDETPQVAQSKIEILKLLEKWIR